MSKSLYKKTIYVDYAVMYVSVQYGVKSTVRLFDDYIVTHTTIVIINVWFRTRSRVSEEHEVIN